MAVASTSKAAHNAAIWRLACRAQAEPLNNDVNPGKMPITASTAAMMNT